MRIHILRQLIALLALTVVSLRAQAVPPAFNYQGRLTDDQGQALSSGEYTIAFRLWSDPTSPSTNNPNHLVWGRERSVTVVNGGFNVILDDSGAPVAGASVTGASAAFSEPSRFLELTIIRTPAGTVPQSQRKEILPRQQILSAPYAIEADRAYLAMKLAQEAMDQLVPPGTVVAWMGKGTNPPPGWEFCHGQQVPKTGKYARLYAAIGTGNYGDDHPDEFQLPDLRGTFLRGVNANRMNGTEPYDPDVASRLIYDPERDHDPNPDVKQWAVGSVQPDAFRAHRHYFKGQFGWGNWTFGGNNWAAQITDDFSGETQIVGGSETRPKNVYVHYLIKL